MSAERKEPLGPESNLMSRATFDRLSNELAEAEEKVRNAGISIGDAAGGKRDWHDNFAYEQAVRESHLNQANLLKLKQQLQFHAIIEPNQRTETISIGNTVKVLFQDEVDHEEYTILGEYDSGTNPSWISYTSPLGSALLGKSAGDVAEYNVNKNTLKVAIEEVLPGNFDKEYEE